MHKDIKATVLLPIYNAEKYLKAAIESVLCQSFENFELLLLNDGSNDSSESIIDRFVVLDERCKKLSWPNKGLIETLNIGIKEAKGEIIFRMDADDICQPNRFENQLHYLENHPECVVLGSKVLLIDEDDLPIMPVNVPLDHDEIDASNFIGHGSSIVHPTVAIRKDALKQIGGYREQYIHAEDIDLFLRLAECGRVHNLPDILLHYRQHAKSIGYAKRKEQVASIQRAINDAQKRRGITVDANLSKKEIKSPPIGETYRKWAWWALQGQNLKTARKYSLKAIKSEPFRLDNLRLLFCVIRGY